MKTQQQRDKPQTRCYDSKFKTRQEQEGQPPVIEGYAVVFNSITEIWPGVFEEVQPGAFGDTLQDDIRALINHDTTLVLGRNTAGTLELQEDEKGLYISIEVNPNDSDAMNLYERVKRGDVSQCSFGFDIEEEEADYPDDGTAKFTLKKVRLYEVSVCTFPAYEETGVEARAQQVEDHRQKSLDAKKRTLINKLKRRK